MSLAVIVQMRLDSSRLPAKALLPFGDGTLSDAVFARLSRIPADMRVLATDVDGARKLGPIAAAHGFETFTGPKEDVLARFAMAIGAFRPDRIVRATGDNPFVSPELATMLCAFAADESCDYAGYAGMPVGMGVECVDAEALLAADRESVDPYEREHVCPWLYRHPERWKVRRPRCPDEYSFPEGRVTVDLRSDYEDALRIAGSLGSDPDSLALVRYLRSRESDG